MEQSRCTSILSSSQCAAKLELVLTDPRKQFLTIKPISSIIEEAFRPGATSKDVLNASSIIEERGFTVYDSLVHGEGGKSPELGTRSSAHIVEPYEFKENMVVVIQPNPVTLDGKAGLQLGAANLVTNNGAISLHEYPFKFPVCG